MIDSTTTGTRDLFEAIYTTRSLRRFRSDPIPDADLRQLLEAATRAPSGRNSQPWRFLIIRDPALRRQVGEIYYQVFDTIYPAEQLERETDPHLRRIMRSARYLAEKMGTEPPVLVVVCNERAPGTQPPSGTAARTAGSSVYLAVQNLLLAARGLGIGGCLTTIHIQREDEIKAILGIPPNADTYALIPIGYPTDKFGPLRRRPIDEVAFADRWGQRLNGAPSRIIKVEG